MPWSLKKSINALEVLVHLLLSAIDPDLSNMMNMLIGTRLASSPVAAQVLPVPIDVPMLVPLVGLKMSPPAPLSPPDPEVGLTVPELIVPAEPLPPGPLGKPLVLCSGSELQPANAIAARPPAAIKAPRPALRPLPNRLSSTRCIMGSSALSTRSAFQNKARCEPGVISQAQPHDFEEI